MRFVIRLVGVAQMAVVATILLVVSITMMMTPVARVDTALITGG